MAKRIGVHDSARLVIEAEMTVRCTVVLTDHSDRLHIRRMMQICR